MNVTLQHQHNLGGVKVSGLKSPVGILKVFALECFRCLVALCCRGANSWCNNEKSLFKNFFFFIFILVFLFQFDFSL